MHYGGYTYTKIENVPKEVTDAGLTPVYVPRQDGWHEHYELLDKEGDMMCCCGDLSSLMRYTNELIEKQPS